SAGRDEDEQPAGQVADVGEAVPVAAGNEEEVAGAGLDGLVAVDETEVTGQDVEGLLLAAVGVGRCSAAGGHRCLQHTQGAAGLRRAELDGGGVAVQPLGGAFVAADEEAVAARPAGVVLVGDGRGPEGHGGLPSLRSRRAGQAEARRRARVATAASRSVAGGRTRGSRTRRWETTAPMKWAMSPAAAATPRGAQARPVRIPAAPAISAAARRGTYRSGNPTRSSVVICWGSRVSLP